MLICFISRLHAILFVFKHFRFCMKHYNNTFFVSLLLRNTPSSWKWFHFIFFPDCDFLCSCSLILRLFRHLNRSLLQPFVCSLFPYLFRLARLLRQKFPHTNQSLVKIWPLKNVYLNYAKHTQNTESAIFPVLPVCVCVARARRRLQIAFVS